MPAQITLSQSVTARVAKNYASFSADAQTTGKSYGTVVNRIQVIGTAAEVLVLGDIVGTPVALMVKHHDTSNYLELALDAGMTKKIAKIYPGRFAVFPPATGTIYARANTAAIKALLFAVGA